MTALTLSLAAWPRPVVYAVIMGPVKKKEPPWMLPTPGTAKAEPRPMIPPLLYEAEKGIVKYEREIFNLAWGFG